MLRLMAMRMTILASGSRGNATVLSSSNASILVDAGISCKETLKRMKAAGEDPHKLTAILISHEHNDHVTGLEVLARKLRVPVYITEATYHVWRRSTRDAVVMLMDGGRRQLQHAGTLSRHQPRDHHDLAARKFEGVVMNVRVVHVDLTETSDFVFDPRSAE